MTYRRSIDPEENGAVASVKSEGHESRPDQKDSTPEISYDTTEAEFLALRIATEFRPRRSDALLASRAVLTALARMLGGIEAKTNGWLQYRVSLGQRHLHVSVDHRDSVEV